MKHFKHHHHHPWRQWRASRSHKQTYDQNQEQKKINKKPIDWKPCRVRKEEIPWSLLVFVSKPEVSLCHVRKRHYLSSKGAYCTACILFTSDIGGGGVRPDRCLMIQACTTLWCYCDSSCRSFVAVGCLCPLNCRWGASQGLCWGEGPCPQALEGRFSSSASPHWGLLSPDRQGRETSWNTEVQRWAPIS